MPIAVQKLAALTNQKWSASDSRRMPKELAGAKTATTRNLGFDFTLTKRRHTKVFSGRMDGFAGRMRKVIKRRRKGGNTARAVCGLVNAKTCWGVEVIGCATSQLDKRRTAAHVALVKNAAGRSATIDFALDTDCKWHDVDPGFRLCTAPIISLAQAIWDGWLKKGWL